MALLRRLILAFGLIAVIGGGYYYWATTDWYARGPAVLPTTKPKVGAVWLTRYEDNRKFPEILPTDDPQADANIAATLRVLQVGSTDLLQDRSVIRAFEQSELTCRVDLEQDEWQWADGEKYRRLLQTSPARAEQYARELEKLPLPIVKIDFFCRSSFGSGVVVGHEYGAYLKERVRGGGQRIKPFYAPLRPGEYYLVVSITRYITGDPRRFDSPKRILFVGTIVIEENPTESVE